MQKKIILLFTAMAGFFLCYSQKETTLQVLKSFPIMSAGGWDYLAVSPVHDWLYVSHGTQVNILNKATGDSVGIIENTTGVHGIAFDTKDNKGFTSNGRLNNVTIFDLNSNKVLGQVTTGANPDAILYEPFSGMIVTCNGRSKNLSIIDPKTEKLMDSIFVDGKPETAVSDGKGKLFVNIEDKNEIVAIDMKTYKVLDHWSILPGEEPSGLAIDVKNGWLFAGCDKLLMVVDAKTGKVIDKLTIGEGCDGVGFDAKLKNIYSSNGDGTLTVIHEEKKNKFRVEGNVPTKKSARTITVDQETHLVYLPAAEFEPLEANQKGRPKMKPRSFQVLVIGNP